MDVVVVWVSYFEGGGKGGGAGGAAGIGGTVTIGGSGGNGGDGGGDGINSSSFTTPFTIPSALTTYINNKYCGGGGGSSTDRGGKAGLNGAGGAESGYNELIGQSASSYGSAGGGAGDIGEPLNSNIPGGAGAAGVVIIYFQYP